MEEEVKTESGPKEHIESLFERGRDYLDTQMEIWRLQLIRKSSTTTSSFVSIVLICFIFFFFFTILNIGISLWIGELLGKTYYGFFAVAGFYLLTGLILYAMRDSLVKRPIANRMIKNMTSKNGYK